MRFLEKTIAKFSVKYLQILNEKGQCNEKLKPKLSKEQLLQLYESMILMRAFDEKALKLQRQGRLGTYASLRGQEACQAGSAFLFEKQDLIFPAFREHGVFLIRGTPPEMLFQFWAGDEQGMQIPQNCNMFSVAITVGAQPLHAVGAAISFSLQKKPAATITYFSDGATSTGDFHEAMNFAGVFKAPCIFICQNNQYAISLPVKEQTASQTIAQKALAYGFEGIQVDGNDVFAVWKATLAALKKARAGRGPTLIECFTYRLGDHTTSDDAKKYRKESEVLAWQKKDPIERLKKYLQKKKLWNPMYEIKVRRKSESAVEQAVQKAESIPPEQPENIFKYIFKELTPELKEQQESLQKNEA